MKKRTLNELKELRSTIEEELREEAKSSPIKQVYDKDLFPKEVKRLMSEKLVSYEGLAHYFGVSKLTISNWLKKYPEFKQAYDEGKKANYGDIIEDTLYKTAQGYYVTEKSVKETTIKGKLESGVFCAVPATETTTKKVFIKPDQKALHTILYNTLGDKYKDTSKGDTNIIGIKAEQHNNIALDAAKLSPDQLKTILDITKQLTNKGKEESYIEAEIIE